ncbi:MAG: glycoside hydrolase family 3 C-terminal domain-containing protein [Clostridia bacterium]|nr:glycoside hydrolase family 3 C-terminal domain-containing protein [Clostridia bacterium]
MSQYVQKGLDGVKDTCRWQRAKYLPCLPLGEDGRRVTGCEKHTDLALNAAREGMVLLKNNGALPLKKGQKTAVFGIAQLDYVRGGTGAGKVRCAFEKNIIDGLSEKAEAGDIELFTPLIDYYRKDLEAQREKALKEGFDLPHFGPSNAHQTNLYRFFGRAEDRPLPDDLLIKAKAFTDTAIVVLSRVTGEYFDRPREEFNLSAGEKELIETLEKNFKTVIAVINSGAQIEVGWTESDGISALLLMMTPGQMGGKAAADIICGTVNPSGKLTDTYARNYEDYPSSENFEEDPYYVNYTEDIFVGYRYFETIPGAAEKVVYPFGFGLSYTSFSREILSASESDGSIQISVKVTNTGKVAGKEVVQVYYEAPQGALGKALRSLCAFRKTRLLAPGGSETLELSFKADDMASYDDTGLLKKSAYVLERGDYNVYVGNSVRDAEKAFVYRVNEPFIVTKQLAERCPCVALTKKMKPDGAYEKLAPKILKRPEYKEYPVTRQKLISEYLEDGTDEMAEIKTNDFEYKGKTRSLEEVLDGKITLDEFISQLDIKTMANLLGGIPSVGICQTSGFGGMSKYGIPPIMTSDSPAGLRTIAETGVRATCFPSAVVMASTWDPSLVEAEAEAIALEIKENNMYAWLGPSMNIHRDPLCGRNFEYYSEDPLIAGKMGAAAVRGAQKVRVSGCPKHFAANNKELNRRDSDSRVTERALREIYLKGFEICVKESDPKTVMSSYNYVNGIRSSESADLLTWILREEWGFHGLVMTDWVGHGRHAVEVAAGNDLKMSAGDPRMVVHMTRDQALSQGALEEAVRNLLRLILWYEGADFWTKK